MDHPLNISGIEIFEYRLSLKRPFSVIDQTLNDREGLILHLITDSGTDGVGEAAPLVGLSRETLKKAAFGLHSLRRDLLGCEVPLDLSGMRSFFDRSIFKGICPSVRFAVESAVVHVMAQRTGCLPAEIMGCSDIKDIAVAGLVQGTLEEIKTQTRVLLDEGFDVLKLKVGNRNIPLDVQKFKLLREIIGPQRKIRLDANRAWSLTEAVAFAKNTGAQGVEFIEEPLKKLDDLPVFVHETGFPVALDESIKDAVVDEFVFPDGVVCVVIKPTIVGGVLKTLDWIAKAGKEGRSIVISSSFESGVAGRLLANLAAFSPLAAGLATDDWLGQDLLPSMRSGGRALILRSTMHLQWKDIDHRMLKGVGQA